MNEGYGQPTQATRSLGGTGAGSCPQTKQQTINDQLINTREVMQDLLQKLRAISDRAGTNRTNDIQKNPECAVPAQSNAMRDVVNDISDMLMKAHLVTGEIQAIV